MTPKARLRSITQKKAGALNPPLCGIAQLTHLNVLPPATLRWSSQVLRFRNLGGHRDAVNLLTYSLYWNRIMTLTESPEEWLIF
jgi:hypothetical protein